MIFKNIYENLKRWYQKKLKERDRNLGYFENRFYEFMEFLFVKEKVSREKIKKKLFMSDDEFKLIENFAKKEKYVNYSTTKKNKEEYEINQKGINFLLKYKKIKQEQKTSFWMRWATITIAIFTLLTFIINFSASIYPMNSDFCPSQINKYPNYATTFSVPFSNLGGKASFVRLSHIGDNFKRIDEDNLHVVDSGEKPTFKINLQIINPEMNKTEVYFQLKYQSLMILPKLVKTETCFYEKDDYGNFDLIEQR